MNFVNVNAARARHRQRRRPLVLAGLTNVNSDINVFSPYGDTVYNGLQTSFQSARPRRVGDVAYTWSKTTNYADNAGGNAAGAGGPRIQYLPEKERNKGLAGYDRTHNLQVWALRPAVRREPALGDGDGVSRWIFGGWSAQWHLERDERHAHLHRPEHRVQPERPRQRSRSLTCSGYVATFPDDTGEPSASRRRWQRVPVLRSLRLRRGQHPGRPGAAVRELAAQHASRAGLLERRPRTVPPSRVPTLLRQFRFEVLNVFNHHNFSNPGNNISDPATFGFITSTTGIGERNLRLGFRVTF